MHTSYLCFFSTNMSYDCTHSFLEQWLYCNDSSQDYDYDSVENNNDDNETLQYSISEVKIFFVSGRVYRLRKLAN